MVSANQTPVPSLRHNMTRLWFRRSAVDAQGASSLRQLLHQAGGQVVAAGISQRQPDLLSDPLAAAARGQGALPAQLLHQRSASPTTKHKHDLLVPVLFSYLVAISLLQPPAGVCPLTNKQFVLCHNKLMRRSNVSCLQNFGCVSIKPKYCTKKEVVETRRL